ncbi:TlpA family protein disulfide reductase [Sphingobacterium tabacisoli]|uniref:TlpA family protein disulfide reductase n=1 Tax=Sphingobacterium tabacisoli TaxID=2044855 RepID=A0ABW5L6H7_9SPHI|nr:TlpA disulfide reductase family protein [Sphingobacterium tabacisoli]
MNKGLIIALLLLSGSAWAQQDIPEKYNYQNFKIIGKVQEQEKQYNAMLQDLPSSILTPEATNVYRAELAFAWLGKGNVERYEYYKSTNLDFDARQLLYVAQATDKLFDAKEDYTAVARISGQLLKEIKEGTQSDELGQAALLMELNAAANAKLGNIEQAKAMIEASATAAGSDMRDKKYFKDSQSNYLNRRAIVMASAGQHQLAFEILEKAFADAESNPYMVANFKEIYTKVKGSDKGFDQYLKSLTGKAYQKYYKEIEAIYVQNPTIELEGTIPDPEDNTQSITTFRSTRPMQEITLTDLQEKPVRLADYNGKILVIDFWSTICTPCIAAFSGFERVIADYSKEDLQLFVIDLFEDHNTVKGYVEQKGITLDVLRDEENAAYDVQGTPTKIVFDPAGNIRFFSTGYAGSTDREYYKLKAMVEITKARAAAKTIGG